MNEITHADLFNGIDGFRLGLQKAGGYRCVWSCDNNPNANEIHTRHFGSDNHITEDIREVDPRSIPDHDILTAGFPCPSFSIAGSGKGFKDTRGTLFFEIARIAEAKRPALLLLENVLGLLSNDEGQTFATILEILGRLGYWIEWQVLSTHWFGLPQSRRRVFIIGHHGGEPRRTIFPIPRTGSTHIRRANRPAQIACLPGRDDQAARIYDPRGTAVTIKARAGGDGAKTGFYLILQKNQRDEYRIKNKVGTITQIMGGKQSPFIIPVLTPERNEKRQHGRRFKDPGEPMFTMTTMDSHGVVILDSQGTKGTSDNKFRIYNDKFPTLTASRHKDTFKLLTIRGIRKLTETECERLQGFPDGWTKGYSYSKRIERLGNAVTVDVIEFLGHRIKALFK